MFNAILKWLTVLTSLITKAEHICKRNWRKCISTATPFNQISQLLSGQRNC